MSHRRVDLVDRGFILQKSSTIVVNEMSSHEGFLLGSRKLCIFMWSKIVVVDEWPSRGWVTLLGKLISYLQLESSTVAVDRLSPHG